MEAEPSSRVSMPLDIEAVAAYPVQASERSVEFFGQPLFFRPVRIAVAAYENWHHAPPTHAQVSSALDKLLKQPPSDSVSGVYADRALQQFNSDDPTASVQANVVEQLIASIESVDHAPCFVSSLIRSHSKARFLRKPPARSFTPNSQLLIDGCIWKDLTAARGAATSQLCASPGTLLPTACQSRQWDIRTARTV